MLTLFPEDPVYPNGFEYYEDFISSSEEQELIEEIKKASLHPFVFQGFEAKRKVASFGWDYSFDDRNLKRGQEIPAGFHGLIRKVSDKLNIPAEEFGELLLIEYPPESVMNWHRDAPPFDMIAGISLQSDCTFKLRPQDKKLQTRQAIISVPVKRRSLYLMKNEVRTDWQHSVAPVKQLRYSITLRTLKSENR